MQKWSPKPIDNATKGKVTLTTLSEAKASTLINVAGACNNSPEFLALLNESTRRLLRKGDWEGTTQPIYICAYNGCVVFNRYVGAVRRLSICNQTVEVENLWWNWAPRDHLCRWNTAGIWHSMAGRDVHMSAFGRTPVFQDILGEGRLVRAYARCQNDLGKTIKIFGTDNNGQALHERDSNGNWRDGITLTLITPFASTDVYVRSVTRIIKQQTQCPVDMYAYWASEDALEVLAHYDPSETNPSYAKYQLEQGCCQSGCVRGLLALIKLQFVPVQVDTDLVLIQNLDALKDMMQSIKLREAGDIEGAARFQSSATRELNNELRDANPDDQFAGVDRSTGGITFTNQCF